ncbi:hypothetical protein C5C00_14270 [Rathayibacter rathayi]|nr:hypothetical protein C5C00_14270 [Rathayibacter rathayi]
MGVVAVFAVAFLAVVVSPIWFAFTALIAAINVVRLVREMITSSAPTLLSALLVAVNITAISTIIVIFLAGVLTG